MANKQLEDLGMHTEDNVQWELDPVCGMEVDPESTQYHLEYGSKKYYFCNKSCFSHFKADPEHYVWDK